jgi:hypothetical protein
MSEANTSQEIEHRKLELVEALGAVIAPMQKILDEHKSSQLRLAVVSERLRRVTLLMYGFCAAVALLLAMSIYAMIRQTEDATVRDKILAETYKQKELISQQASKKDVARVQAKLDEQPTFKVRPPSSTDPSAAPVVVIETPVPSAKASTSAAHVEIPVEFPKPKDRP